MNRGLGAARGCFFGTLLSLPIWFLIFSYVLSKAFLGLVYVARDMYFEDA